VAAVEHAHASSPPEEAARAPQPVGDDEVAPKLGGLLATEGGVQHAEVVGERSQQNVDLVVEEGLALAPVLVLDACAARERHWDPTGEATLFVHRREGRGVQHGHAMDGTEEIRNGHAH
jgi:hypothetical protein